MKFRWCRQPKPPIKLAPTHHDPLRLRQILEATLKSWKTRSEEHAQLQKELDSQKK